MKLSDCSNVGHVPDLLACVLAPMLEGGKVEHIEGTAISVARSAPEGIWVIGGSNEFPSEYVLYGTKKDRENIRQTLREVQKSRKRKIED